MEKIKVNMSPNPLDVQTIHASQNDGEARQWEFELHNNGELIDTSDVKEQLVFKSYNGGTEQLLPENGSTPTTSPFLGDIKYPQGLLTDQEFTYRESPTQESGNARLRRIKGNTLGWNQLFKIYSPTTVTTNGVTITTNADGTVTLNGTATARTVFVLSTVATSNGLLTSNHIYCMLVCPKGGSPNTYFGGVAGLVIDTGNGGLWKYNYTWVSSSLRMDIFEGVTFNNVSFKPQYIDLTLLFGVEKAEEILAMGQADGVAYLRSLFSNLYYDYNTGALLSFNGNGIKTVGFNLFDQDSVLTSVGFVEQSDGSFYIQSPSTAQNRVLFENKLKYSGQFFLVYKFKYVNTTSQGCRFEVHYTDGRVDQIYAAGSNDFVEASFISRADKVLDYINATYGANISTWWKDVCINISDTERNGTYEPYTSSTLSLPISTYFPNGMKSAGNVYDELTESKAITRIGRVDLGSLNWSYVSADRRFIAIISDAKSSSSLTVLENIVSAKYENATWENILTKAKDKIISLHYTSNNSYVAVIDNDYSDASTFKSAMSGVMLYYELATPTETSFTTASLVTENAEIPLSNEDGVLIGKCTEQLSENPGFIDAKIKLSDSDGECYSNKLQLHVERSPQ